MMELAYDSRSTRAPYIKAIREGVITLITRSLKSMAATARLTSTTGTSLICNQNGRRWVTGGLRPHDHNLDAEWAVTLKS